MSYWCYPSAGAGDKSFGGGEHVLDADAPLLHPLEPSLTGSSHEPCQVKCGVSRHTRQDGAKVGGSQHTVLVNAEEVARSRLFDVLTTCVKIEYVRVACVLGRFLRSKARRIVASSLHVAGPQRCRTVVAALHQQTGTSTREVPANRRRIDHKGILWAGADPQGTAGANEQGSQVEFSFAFRRNPVRIGTHSRTAHLQEELLRDGRHKEPLRSSSHATGIHLGPEENYPAF
mmetsp:Transcript_41559/g.67136  ORF Transcript_41559/g.67136 Transcript_41559/m.67136 type:complete len:231 (+) Transcript_41559:236-928(+)